MGLASALNSTVSALRSQGTAIAAVSENISNASTTAYKTRVVNFQALVDNTGGSTAVGEGVIAQTSQNLSQSGSIASTGVKTNIAINGQGFFVVTDNINNQPSGYTYSRNGNFAPDANGNLVNDEGNYLLGQPTNNLGVVTAVGANDLSSLKPVSVSAIQGAASATTTIT